jgi:hypothetical protein
MPYGSDRLYKFVLNYKEAMTLTYARKYVRIIVLKRGEMFGVSKYQTYVSDAHVMQCSAMTHKHPTRSWTHNRFV